MILYIHGFGSCGWGQKSLRLRRFFGTAEIIAPDLPFAPDAAIRHLQDLLHRYPVSALIGASLGGFYAAHLNTMQVLPSVLINPVVHPSELQAAFVGRHRRWCDDMPFEVDTLYLNALDTIHRQQPGDDEHYLVLLQQGDEVLDYREAEAFYSNHHVVSLAGGDHRFGNIDERLPLIADWLQQKDALPLE